VSFSTSTRAVLALGIVCLCSGASGAQQQSESAPGPAASITALVEQLVDLFPAVEGDVLEVQAERLTLDAGRRAGIRPGLAVEVFRVGREIKHPRTGQVLGKSEEILGTARVSEVQERFSTAILAKAGAAQAGDRYRLSSAKIRIALVPLTGGARETLVEAAMQELVERINGTGRFQVTMGDAANADFAQQGLSADDVLQGKGVARAAERLRVDQVLVVRFRRVESRPFMDARFFSLPAAEPLMSTAFFVPPSIRAASQSRQFSASRSGADPPQAKQRSLLARLLGLDKDVGAFSSAESSLPLREVARFPFPVMVMDVAVQPKDRVPRAVLSDAEHIYMYKIVGQKFEPVWTLPMRGLGRIFWLQLVDLDGDGVFEVVGNRFHHEAGLGAFILAGEAKPRVLIDEIGSFLFAVDARAQGVKQTLWTQPYSAEKFFSPGQAEEVRFEKGRIVPVRPVTVHPAFRPMGATFSNISGKDTRVLAFVDEFNRLQISSEREDLWRSSTSVGGGYLTLEAMKYQERGGRVVFHKIEPTPLSVDLDGDGIEEILVSQNAVKEGLMAVVYKGPAGFRLQSIDTGFEGGITCIGAFKTEDATQPSVLLTVVQFSNLFKRSGVTRVIMSIPQD
jgi:hypothetical protein